MSNLLRVTITGADNSTDIAELVDLAAQYPFLELGILVSKRQEGSPRFPGRDWIAKFCEAATLHKFNVSTHLCGRWVRELLLGELHWYEVPDVIDVSNRLQINTHAETLPNRSAFADNLRGTATVTEAIFQWDGINNHLTHAARGCGINASALFDKSGGAGILPASWPLPERDFWCGYAGGLGPDNVVDQVLRIDAISSHLGYWIDMERKVRTVDDSALDMAAVRSVLASCAKLIEASNSLTFSCAPLA